VKLKFPYQNEKYSHPSCWRRRKMITPKLEISLGLRCTKISPPVLDHFIPGVEPHTKERPQVAHPLVLQPLEVLFLLAAVQ
jgi:hypothetical protein